LLNVSAKSKSYAYCVLLTQCPVGHNISVRVDPNNEIKEYDENNNDAWKEIELMEKLIISIDNPTNGQEVSRCYPLSLSSTVTASCSQPSDYEVFWYNSTTLIGIGEDSIWCLGSSDNLLGPETINATVIGGGYVNSSETVNINIVNNPPNIEKITYNVTPPEIHTGEGIRIECKVDDNHSYFCNASYKSCIEDAENELKVNISIKVPYPADEWSNETANYNGSIFYRDYGTSSTSPLGYYQVACSALDSDSGSNEKTSEFLVYQNVTISVFLNKTKCWWRDWIRVYGQALQINGNPVGDANVSIMLLGKVVNKTKTNSTGHYEAIFRAPSRVGVHLLSVVLTHPTTGKKYGNVTTFNVALDYGKSEEEMESAKNVGCYEVPRFIQNPDGSIEKVIVKVCVWK